MKIGLISFTPKGAVLNRKLMKLLQEQPFNGERLKEPPLKQAKAFESVKGYHLSKYPEKELIAPNKSLKEWTQEAFNAYDAIIFIGATGIAVRAIAPFIVSKAKDPAVLVIDEMGRYIISLLSGHIGGANDLARQIAYQIKGEAIISTATDLEKVFAVDEWAKKQNLLLQDVKVQDTKLKDMKAEALKYAKNISAALLQKEEIGLVSELEIEGELPLGLKDLSSIWQLEGPKQQGLKPFRGIYIGYDKTQKPFEETLQLIPKQLVLGIGCKKGTSKEAIETLVQQTLEGLGFEMALVCQIASIDLKQEEVGLLAFAKAYDKPIAFYSSEELNALEGDFSSSPFVKQITKVDNVCERAAVKASLGGELILKKTALAGVTLAIAKKPMKLSFETEF